MDFRFTLNIHHCWSLERDAVINIKYINMYDNNIIEKEREKYILNSSINTISKIMFAAKCKNKSINIENL